MNGWGGRDVGRLGDWGSKRVVWFGLGWGIRRRGRGGFSAVSCRSCRGVDVVVALICC